MQTTAETSAAPNQRKPRSWTKRYMPEQVNMVLRDYDSGTSLRTIGERHKVSKATLYRWIAQYQDDATVDEDVGCLKMRVAVLEKTVLRLSTMLAEGDAPAEGIHAAQ